MTTLRRLLLCLFALALLPGAQARVAMPEQGVVVVAAMADATDAHAGGCHDAPIVEPATRLAAQHAGAGSDHAANGAADAASSMDCCPGHDGGMPSCGDACACPLLLTIAVLPAPLAGPAFHERQAWQRQGHSARTGPTDGPPRRPPIG
jgi:hypothetical protein